MTMTAILAVAVACYSRVTGAEEGTIAALRTVSRELANFEIRASGSHRQDHACSLGGGVGHADPPEK
jgi:hypothetical protein